MARKLSDYLRETRNFDSKKLGSKCDEKEIKKIVELTIAEFMEPLMKEINEIKKEIQDLKDLITGTGARSPRVKESINFEKRDKSRLNKLKIYIKKNGYVLASHAARMLALRNPHLSKIVESSDFIALDIGGDYAIFLPETYEEFINLLSNIDTPDPEEALRRLDKYKDLFYILRSQSIVYYDSKAKEWRILT